MSTPVKKLGNLFQIGTQLDLPLGKIGEIAWRNMKHRFGRSIVTTSGVILATAFLMAMLIKNSVVGSMLEATRSLKAVTVNVKLTPMQVKNIRTVLTNQMPVLEAVRTDAQERLAESKKSASEITAALARLQTDLKAVSSPDGTTALAGKEKEFRLAMDAVRQQTVEMGLKIANVEAMQGDVNTAEAEVTRAHWLLDTVQPEMEFSTHNGSSAERDEALKRAQFLQRQGEQLESELQSHSVQDAPTAKGRPDNPANPAPPGGAPAQAAAAAEAPSASGPRDIWLTGLALIVAGVGITNAMLMSVTERFREIGTMKCLGALDSFILKLFLIESAVQGGMGTLAGMVLGFLLMGLYLLWNFGWNLVAAYWPWASVGQATLVAFGAGVVISIIGAAFPSLYASKMDPIAAMRQEI